MMTDAMDVDAPRGAKRKADDLLDDTAGPRRIKVCYEDMNCRSTLGLHPASDC